MRRLITDKKGAALTIAIILIVISTFMVTALLWYSSASMKRLEMRKSLEQAEYYARSGIYAAYTAYFRNAAKFTASSTSAAPVYIIKNTAADGTETITYSSSSSTSIQNPLPQNCIGYFIVNINTQYVPYTGAANAVRFISTGTTATGVSFSVTAYSFDASKLIWE